MHIVTHWQKGDWKWEIDQVKWVAKSTSTGEVFRGNELDMSAPTDQGFAGTWRANIKGDLGDHYQITFAVSWDGVIFSLSFVQAKCH